MVTMLKTVLSAFNFDTDPVLRKNGSGSGLRIFFNNTNFSNFVSSYF